MEKGHGRSEQRPVEPIGYLDWPEPTERKRRLGLRGVMDVVSIRETNGSTNTGKRYNLTSHPS